MWNSEGKISKKRKKKLEGIRKAYFLPILSLSPLVFVCSEIYVNNPFAFDIQLEGHKIMFMVNNIKPALTIAVIYMSRYETNKHLEFKICMQISYIFSNIFEKCEFAV